jgi:hypothetical protein
MTRVVLSTLEFDPLAPVEIEATDDSDFGDAQRRLNRVATLDGGAVFNDFGFTHADRTFSIVFRPDSMQHAELVKRLVQTYPKITISMKEGVFRVAPFSYLESAETMRLTLLVEAKLSA